MLTHSLSCSPTKTMLDASLYTDVDVPNKLSLNEHQMRDGQKYAHWLDITGIWCLKTTQQFKTAQSFPTTKQNILKKNEKNNKNQFQSVENMWKFCLLVVDNERRCWQVNWKWNEMRPTITYYENMANDIYLYRLAVSFSATALFIATNMNYKEIDMSSSNYILYFPHGKMHTNTHTCSKMIN